MKYSIAFVGAFAATVLAQDLTGLSACGVSIPIDLTLCSLCILTSLYLVFLVQIALPSFTLSQSFSRHPSLVVFTLLLLTISSTATMHYQHAC